MTKIEWKDRKQLGPATSDQIAQIESRVGHRFPDDFRRALTERQGMKPVPNNVEVFPGRPALGFGKLRSCVNGDIANIADAWDGMRSWNDRPYPSYLVPISIGRGSAHFALDYRSGEESPSIAWVNTDAIPDDDDFAFHVASSFSELLGKLI